MKLNDAQINELTMDKLGKWPSFEAQSWACKVAHVVQDATIDPDALRFRALAVLVKIANDAPYDDAELNDQQRAIGEYIRPLIDSGEKLDIDMLRNVIDSMIADKLIEVPAC